MQPGYFLFSLLSFLPFFILIFHRTDSGMHSLLYFREIFLFFYDRALLIGGAMMALLGSAAHLSQLSGDGDAKKKKKVGVRGKRVRGK